MAQQQPVTTNQSAANTTSNTSNLYPQIDTAIAPLDVSERNLLIVAREKELASCLTNVFTQKDILEGVIDRSIVPQELLVSSRKLVKPKIDPLKRLKDLNPVEEAEEEEEDEETEDDEEQEPVEDDEEDAGGDYLVSHFDNGENFEENDDEDDDNVVN